jgi:hypothetical protein
MIKLAADNWDTTKLELYKNLIIILHTQLMTLYLITIVLNNSLELGVGMQRWATSLNWV